MLMGSNSALQPYLSLKQNQIKIRNLANSTKTFQNTGIVSNQQHLLTLSRVSNSLQPAVDSNTLTAKTASGTMSFSEFLSYGSGNLYFRFIGNCQEIILYDSNESSNRVGIETNINAFYSIY